MRPVHTFSVIPSLPLAIEGLREVAFNLRWSWSHESVELFRRLDQDLWEKARHNPVLMLGTIEQTKLETAAADDGFLAHLHRVESNLRTYLSGEMTWFRRNHGQASETPLIAYFSAEFGLTECLSIFAGGLGILAGDHLKSASDLGIPLVAVGLLYQQGYFRQYMSQSGWRQEAYVENDFHNLPISIVHQPDGKPLSIEVDLAGRAVFAQVWRRRWDVYLSTCWIQHPVERACRRPRPDEPAIRRRQRETHAAGDPTRNVGLPRLHALGLQPTVYHMNEGHSAFLAVEHVRHLMELHNLNFAEARELASASLVFTTHTPVEAGHDYLSDLMSRYFGEISHTLGLSQTEFLDLGRTHGAGDFCMTVLALRLASRANGVSKLHGEVSRKMWQSLWPEVPVDEIPIGHVTNGVHFCSWISAELNQLYDRYLGPSWREEPANSDIWSRVNSIPAEELWRTHERRRERLVAWARLEGARSTYAPGGTAERKSRPPVRY